MTTPAYGIGLLPQHAATLAASAISPEAAHARGYRSVTEKSRLDSIGITKAGRAVPGLLVPSRGADGAVWGYQYRPDAPRLREGKSVKYETPIGQRNGIDVPPACREALGDPAVPLWVTEGVKKADSGACAGLCIVALPGVWSWRGRNEHGGKTAVADWHDVALNDRRIILAFDSDVVRKAAVRHALSELAAYLRTKGARVEFCHLPDRGDGKTGLDDFLADGHSADELWALVRPDMPDPALEEAAAQSDSPSGGSGGSGGPGGSGGGTHSVAGDPPEDGKRLLDDVRAWLARHITVMRPTDLDVITVWAAHTHVCANLYTTPRLQIDSPVPESGKTTVLEHLERLSAEPILASSISSPALVARMLEHGPKTLLLDEVDRTLDPKKDGVGELLAILNSGYKVGATRPTLVPVRDGGWQTKLLPTYAPVVFAGNQPALPPDTQSRIIRVLLFPDWAGAAEESDWELKDAAARELGARLARWAEQITCQLSARPTMPAGCTGRFREKWQPLARVAQAAGPGWLATILECAARDVAEVAADRDAGLASERPGLLLLRHLMLLWPADSFWRTPDMVATLVREHPDIWGDASPYGRALTMQRLGRMLVSNYQVRSGPRDTSDKYSPHGYRREQFVRAAGALATRRLEVPDDIAPVPPREPPGPPEPPERPEAPDQRISIKQPRCECGNPLHGGACYRCKAEGRSA